MKVRIEKLRFYLVLISLIFQALSLVKALGELRKKELQKKLSR